ncbi:MAG: hypothetical protein J0L93_05795 [Deltaproteobacteria bacterium]|nr:hypothetical protein [Deltaproteobacteria bacterium]
MIRNVGASSVSAGTLTVNGSIQNSPLNISGGIVNGTGTLGSVEVASGGTLTPGNSGVGTLVAGDVTFDSGSTFSFQVAPSSTPLLSVTNAATLGGTLSITQNSGSYTSPSQYTFLTAGSISGTFGTITVNALPNFNYRFENSATTLSIIFEEKSPASDNTSSPSPGGWGCALQASQENFNFVFLIYSSVLFFFLLFLMRRTFKKD